MDREPLHHQPSAGGPPPRDKLGEDLHSSILPELARGGGIGAADDGGGPPDRRFGGGGARALAAEALGCFFLFAGVIGSGVMAEALADGSVALALLANTLATGAILYVLIALLAPVSGAHFNPAVTFAFAARGEIGPRRAAGYVAAQLAGGTLGALAVHLMFDLPILQLSTKTRAGLGQWTGELIATFGLVLTILGLVRRRPAAIPAAVALYIAAAYWFTSSTSFANPAITVVRSLTDSFAGIAARDVPAFVLAQFAGAALATALAGWLFAAGGLARESDAG